MELTSQPSLQLRARAERERRRRLTPSRIDVARYRDDALAFVRDCIAFLPGKDLAPYQADILGNFVSAKRTAVRGPHGLGKTALASWIVLWGILTSDDIKIPVTASAWRQLSKFLWPEIHKWARRLRWDKL